MNFFKRIFILFLGLGLVLGLTSCSQNPLDSLKSNKPSKKYTYAYWVKQYEQKTPTWSDAIKYCSNGENTQKINCRDVLTIDALLGMNIPNSTPKQDFSHLPEFGGPQIPEINRLRATFKQGNVLQGSNR